MKRSVVLLVLGLLLVPALAAQEAQQQQPPDQEQKPPTLAKPGPNEPGPGPRTATVNDYRKLARIRSIYVERMDNALSDRLVECLGKLGRFKFATKPRDADAIMTGSCMESRRLKRVHSEVFLSDRNGASIWQDNILRPFNPPTLQQAVIDTAQVIVEHLGMSLNEAGMK